MLRVNIEYQVADKEGRPFRPLDDIAKDVEQELWDSPLFSEASYYRITVVNETRRSVIEFKRREKK